MSKGFDIAPMSKVLDMVAYYLEARANADSSGETHTSTISLLFRV